MRIRWNALVAPLSAESHCAPYAAATQLLGREPDPPKSRSSSPPPWPGCSTLLRAARDLLQPWLGYSTLASCDSEHAFAPRLPTTSLDHVFWPRPPATPSGVLFGWQNVFVSGSSSSAAIQLLPPSEVTAAVAERYMPLQSRKGVCSSPGTAMNGNKECQTHLAGHRMLQGSLARVPDLRHLPEAILTRRAAHERC